MRFGVWLNREKRGAGVFFVRTMCMKEIFNEMCVYICTKGSQFKG